MTEQQIQIPQAASPVIPLSPVELLLVILNEELNPAICPAGAVGGPASYAQQQTGVLSVVDAGPPKIDPNKPLMYARLQIRCMHRVLETVDRIMHHAYQILEPRHREVVTQGSSGDRYLIHYANVTAGPSTHFDSQVTWEGLMFVELMIGTQPV